MRKLIDIILAVVIGVIIFLMFLVFFSVTTTNCANAAESAIVSFNNAEHLAALQDSVVGVRDTTITTVTRMEEGHSAVADSFRFVLDTVGTTITCRQLAGVTIEPHPKSGKYSAEYQAVRVWDMPGDGSSSEKWEIYYAKLDSVERENVIPGEAIIFYELYKEEQCTK